MPHRTSAPGARRPTVLVTGASGNLGQEVVDRLVDREVRVRGLRRRPAAERPGVEWVVGDLTRRADLRAALTGVDALLLIWPLLDSGPAAGVVAELAARPARVVYLSSTAVDESRPRQSDPIVQVHADMEMLLRRSGLRPVVLRSDTLASNARGWIPQLRLGDDVSGPDIVRTPVVDERDVADAVVAALLAPAGELDDDPYLLTGPESLTRAEQVARLGAALHRPLRFRPLPTELARARMLADGRPGPLVEALIDASLHRPASTRVTADVERLTGRPPRAFSAWAADRAAEFR